MYDKIQSPIQIGGLELKNRIVFAPTTMGLPIEEQCKKIRQIAEGGTGLIIIGDVPVLRSVFGKTLENRKGFERYCALVNAAHQGGAKVCAQLHMPDSSVIRMLRHVPGVLMGKISKEELRGLLNESVSPYITQMAESKVERITGAYGRAAELAVKAGFDMVQVHGDRMCGSFSSSIYNKRTDKYGGSAEGRARFAVEAVTSIRRCLPRLPIDFKLAVRQEEPHYGNAGILEEELPVFIPLLEEAGVNSFHVTLANHGELRDTIPPADHPYFAGEGCFLKYCDTVKSCTRLPICGVGGLSSPDFVEEQLGSGRIQMAAMARQLLADPQWVKKASQGAAGTIQRCIRCNHHCLGGMMRHAGVGCIYDEKQEKRQK